MFTFDERQNVMNELIEFFKSTREIEGVVQIGSSINGFKDEFSDLDFMLVYDGDFEVSKNAVIDFVENYEPYFFKDYVRGEDVSILIFICDNQLELNISLVPFEKLSARSGKFKVIYDANNRVKDKMNETYEELEIDNKFDSDFIYQLAYFIRKVKVYSRRGESLLALQYFEFIRQRILELLVFNMGVKSPQFNEYQKINKQYLSVLESTYVMEVNKESILSKTEQLYNLVLDISDWIDYDLVVFTKIVSFGTIDS